MAASAATAQGIDPAIFSNLIASESSFNPYALGQPFTQNGQTTQAAGIAQFTPGTAQQYGVDPWNASSSLTGAAQYLSDLLGKYGNYPTAIAAYKGYSDPNSPAAQAAGSKVAGGAGQMTTDPTTLAPVLAGSIPQNNAGSLSFWNFLTSPLASLKTAGASILLGLFGLLILALVVYFAFERAAKK